MKKLLFLSIMINTFTSFKLEALSISGRHMCVNIKYMEKEQKAGRTISLYGCKSCRVIPLSNMDPNNGNKIVRCDDCQTGAYYGGRGLGHEGSSVYNSLSVNVKPGDTMVCSIRKPVSFEKYYGVNKKDVINNTALSGLKMVGNLGIVDGYYSNKDDRRVKQGTKYDFISNKRVTKKLVTGTVENGINLTADDYPYYSKPHTNEKGEIINPSNYFKLFREKPGTNPRDPSDSNYELYTQINEKPASPEQIKKQKALQ